MSRVGYFVDASSVYTFLDLVETWAKVNKGLGYLGSQLLDHGLTQTTDCLSNGCTGMIVFSAPTTMMNLRKYLSRHWSSF